LDATGGDSSLTARLSAGGLVTEEFLRYQTTGRQLIG